MKAERKQTIAAASRLGVILLTVFAASLLWSQSSVVEKVKIETGVLGGVAENGVVAFKGVPYAAPPVGELRWRAPQPAAKWTGVRVSAYGPDCLQKPFPSDAAPLGGPMSEDCLYANVWAPAGARKGLPVIFWIYGGGFVNGGSSPAVYNGSYFAKRGVIFVSINYRVGRFGFFGFPALSKEHPEEPKGNYGYMDQIAGLKWVQRNIAAFGGDPKNVTIFGESAGGGSVMTLLTSPLSQGLFARAIVQSGGGRSSLMGDRYLDKTGAAGASLEEIGVNYAKKHGVEGSDAAALAALRKLPAETIVDGLNMMSGMMGAQGAPTYGGPIVDGRIVVESPQDAILAGRWAKVPVMIGATSSDIGFPGAKTVDELFKSFGDKEALARSIFNPDKSDNIWVVGMRVGAIQMMVEPSRFVARAVSEQGIKSYEYRFGYVAESKRKEWPGAPHATDIPYVMNTVRAAYADKTTPADEAAADKANAYWVNFAKTGDPNGAGLPLWPAYTSAKDEILDFTLEGPKPGPDPWRERLDLIESLLPKK